MIELKSVSKRYLEKEVLKNINYTFIENKVYFIVGPSGCGKTTLLNIIGRVDLDYEGIVLFDSEDIKEYTAKDNEAFYTNKVSYISQFPVLFQEMKGQNNLALIDFVNKKTTKKIGSFLKSIKLNKEAKKLSNGEKQRVCINRVINQNAKVILADEPTASLDSQYKKEVMKELIKQSQNKILIVVSHDLDLANEYADEILEIKKGRIKANKNNKQPTINKENNNKNISLFNARRFASWLYKSEKKKVNLYNYSLVIGIVLMAFTNMLSKGLMGYFKSQLLSQDSTNFLEYSYEYKITSNEDLEDIFNELGSRYFDIYYEEKEIYTSLTIDDKTIDIPSFGLINYEINNMYPKDLITIKISNEYNEFISEKYKLDIIGLDFITYVKEFAPEVLFTYFDDGVVIEKEFIVGNAIIDDSVSFSFISSDEMLIEEIVDSFSLKKKYEFNQLIDETFINYIDNQDQYFIKNGLLYRYEKEGLKDIEVISKEKYNSYGNIDVDLEKILLNNKQIECVLHEPFPNVGRKGIEKNEVVVSSKLNKKIKEKIYLTYNQKQIELEVVGLINIDTEQIYFNQKNIEYLYDEFNSFKNYRDFLIKEIIFLKEDLDYQELIDWSNKQEKEYECSLIEVLNGMLPTMKGIEIILNIFSLFSLSISIVTLFVLNVLDFEKKVKEYLMLKRSGYKIKDIIKVNVFKYLFTTKFVIICSIFIIELMKIVMNRFLSQNLGINSLFEDYSYLSKVFIYSLISFVISNIIFILYIIINDKRKNTVI